MKALDHLILSIVRLDRRLFHTIFGVKWDPANHVMRFFTVVGSAGALWGFIAFAGFILGWARSGFSDLPVSGLVIPWASVAGAWLLAEGTKHLFDRARPFSRFPEIAPLIKTPSSSSFPSGHSATAAAGAVSLSVVYPALAPLFAVCALFVMVSRTYLGVHYPFDVFAGALIGVVVASVMLLFL